MFTRWGRTTCPADSTAVYNGFVGGANFRDQASGATILCLADKPIYANYTTMKHDDKRFRSTIYGTEYDSSHAQMYYNKMHNEDMPCVVCESNSKSKTIMVPARNVCYPGWSLEYSGYLFGPADGYASGEYICMDSDPEAVPGGSSNEDGQLLYMVEGMCGSLHCPPYHDHRELTCAVCSK